MTTPTATTGRNSAGSNLTKYNNNFQVPDIQENRTVVREEYYRTSYDVWTGLRIAATLGGFFIIVLLTLLYKSKCKKHSRDPSPVPMDLGQGTGPTPIMSFNMNTNANTNNNNKNNNSTNPSSHQSNNCNLDGPRTNSIVDSSSPPYLLNHKYPNFNSPAVLLTAANSESSDEDLSISGYVMGGHGNMNMNDQYQYQNQYKFFNWGNNNKENNNPNNPNCSSSSPPLPLLPLLPPKNTNTNNSSSSNNKGRMKWLQQSIDIHVILPTPTISPSSSETFTRSHNRNHNRKDKDKDKEKGRDRDRDRDQDKELLLGDLHLSPTPHHHLLSNSLCFLDNLKYADDSESSENIPTRSDFDNDSRRSIGSDSIFACWEEIPKLPKPPPPPPIPVTPKKNSYRKRLQYHTQHNSRCHGHGHGDKMKTLLLPSESGAAVGIGIGLSVSSCPSPCPSTSSNNFHYDPPHYCTNTIVNDPGVDRDPEDDEDDCECKVANIKCTAQVHQRDSLESVNDYLESNKRRSSSTQTTFSDLRRCLNSFVGSGSNASSPRLFPHLGPYFNFPAQTQFSSSTSNMNVGAGTGVVGAGPSSRSNSLIPCPCSSAACPSCPCPSCPIPHNTNDNINPNNPILLRVNPGFSRSRKRSCDGLKKTYSLQCDEPTT